MKNAAENKNATATRAEQPKPKSLRQRLKDWLIQIAGNRRQYEERQKQKKQQNEDQSVYGNDPRDMEEDDMEEDLALLEDEDMGW